MRTPETVKQDFEKAGSELENTIRNFPHEKFNQSPSPDKWSAAGIAEHLAKVEQFVVTVMEGTSQKSDGDRDPELKTPYMEAVYGSDMKFKTFPVLFPSEEPKDKNEMAEKIRSFRDQIIQKAANHSPDNLCDLEHPHFGHLTVIEYVYFVIFHGERHRKQIEALE